MIVVVSGSRFWRHPQFVRQVLNSIYVKHGSFVLYHGDCRDRAGNPMGADAHANDWAATVPGVLVRRFPADWARYGNSAGPIRARQMIQEAKRNSWHPGDVRCEAFQRDGSQGTQNAIDFAGDYKIPCKVWTEDDVPQPWGAGKGRKNAAT